VEVAASNETVQWAGGRSDPAPDRLTIMAAAEVAARTKPESVAEAWASAASAAVVVVAASHHRRTTGTTTSTARCCWTTEDGPWARQVARPTGPGAPAVLPTVWASCRRPGISH